LLVGGCVVDEHYSGEVHLSLFNPGDCEVLIYGDEKIVQGIILRVNYCDVEEISTEKYDELTSNFVRGEKGFGSSDEYQIKDNKNDNKKN